MANRSNTSSWILVAILAVCLQVVFVFADGRPTATGTAIDFSKAFFLLDTGMERYLCSQLINADESLVRDYVLAMNDQAHDRGFGKAMVRQMIYNLETTTLAQDSESATIHIKGVRRTRINPLYAYVAKLFGLGRVHPFQETLELIREDGRWKVCGNPYGLAMDV